MYVAHRYTAATSTGNTSAGGEDFYVVKYNSAGEKQWTRQHGSSADDEAWGVTADASGNIYVTGWTLKSG